MKKTILKQGVYVMRKATVCSILTAILLLSMGINAAEVYQLDAVETISDTSKMLDNNGISDGFLDKNVTVGPFGQKKAIDVPYQINTIPKEVMENEQAQGLQDVVKYIPSAQIEYRGGAELGRPQTRGFQGDVVANSYWDGFHVVSTTAIPMEMFENLQIFNGLAGSLYGPASPSGIYDFERKRPTSTYYNSVMLTYMENENFGVKGDFGGREGMVGYRINIVKQDGEGYVKNSDLERQLISTALDFYLTDRLTLETNFSRYDYTKTGYAGTFSMPVVNGVAKYTLPNAVSSNTAGFGQSYSGMDLETTTASGKLKYDIGNDWYFEGGYLFQRVDRGQFLESNTFKDNSGDYTASQPRSKAAGRFEVDSWMAQVNKKTETWDIGHDLTLGANGYEWTNFGNRATNASAYTLGTSSIYDPTVFNYSPTFTNNTDYYKASMYDIKSLTLGDTIHLDKQWDVMLSLSESSIDQYAYTSSGVKSTSYSDDGESYAASIIYKPLSNLSFYVTYADSLMQGSAGSNSDGTAVILAPSRSKQYEVGAKTRVYNIDFSTALFQITRPIAYQGADGVFAEKGEQRNRGFELMVSGSLTDNLSLYGGVTLLDPELRDAKNALAEGKNVIGMPEVQYNLLLDYSMPISSGILGFNSNFHYTGKRAIDEDNTQWADGYFTTDLGVRYATKKLLGDKTTFRFTVNNVFNEKYWAGVFTSNGLDGLSSSGATSLFLGDTRNVVASIQVNF